MRRQARKAIVSLFVLVSSMVANAASANDIVLTLSGPSQYQSNEPIPFGGQMGVGVGSIPGLLGPTFAGLPGQSIELLVDGSVAATALTQYNGYYGAYLSFSSGDHVVQAVYARGGPNERRSPTLNVTSAGPRATSLYITDATVAEPNSPDSNGEVEVIFYLSLSAATTTTVTVDYSTRNGSATGGVDYAQSSGSLTFLAGETGKQIVVRVMDDLLEENDEFFYMDLSNPTGTTLSRAMGVGTIIEPVEIYFTLSDDRMDEGLPHEVRVRISRASNSTVSVAYRTKDSVMHPPSMRATAGSDYVPANGTLTFLPGERQKTFTIQTLQDDLCEGTEVLALELSNPQGAPIRGSDAIRGLYDDADC